MRLVRLRDVNPATLAIFGARAKEELRLGGGIPVRFGRVNLRALADLVRVEVWTAVRESEGPERTEAPRPL